MFWALFPTAWALDPAESVFQYNCRTWNRQNGLPATSINAITQTRDGYLWMGMQMGLVRFDGIDFTFFDLKQPEFKAQTISSLATDKDGNPRPRPEFPMLTPTLPDTTHPRMARTPSLRAAVEAPQTSHNTARQARH